MEDEAQRLAAYYRGRTVLVTGAYGFIGECVSESLARAGANVRRLHRRPLHSRSTPDVAIEGDLRDPRIWERILSGVDAVVLLAAQTSTKASEFDPDADYAVNVEATRKLVDALVRQALAGEPLTIYGKGDRVRDFVFVEDVARAFLLAGLSSEHCNGRHFLVGSGAPTTVADLVQLIASSVEREAGRTVPVMHIEPPPDEPEIAKCNFSVDPTALEHAIGFRPSISLEAGLTRTVRRFLKSSHPESEKRE